MVRGAEQLLEKLIQSQVVDQDLDGQLFLDALVVIMDKITCMGVDAKVSFVSIQLFCAGVQAAAGPRVDGSEGVWLS